MRNRARRVLVTVIVWGCLPILVGPGPAEPLKKTLAGREQSDAPWTAHLQRVEEALARMDVSAAERAWHEAYAAALRSRRWEGFVEVGDSYLLIGEVAKGRKTAEATARRMYLAALFRARNEGSLDGVLRAAEAFHALGDREVVEQGLRIAEGLAERQRDGQARDRVQAFRERVAHRYLGAKSFDLDPFPLLFPDEIAGP